MQYIEKRSFDWDWFRRHALQEILPRWLRAVAAQDLFLPQLDRQWQSREPRFATLVSQSRLIYNFAQGYALTGEMAYRDAAERGARRLLESFRDSECGGFYWSCAPDGQILDTRKDTYGHAFVLFGLAHAVRATGSDAFLQAARETWGVIDTRLRDGCGGFVQRAARDFSAPAAGRSANPLMHLFEALLALGDLDASYYEDAARLATFMLRHVDPGSGLLPELYADDWRALSSADGGCIDLGHAFEWAYLLSSAVERGLPAALLPPAIRFLDGGVRLGLDRDEGGIYSRASLEGETQIAGKGWWEQCEATRALLHFAVLRRREDLWPTLELMLRFIRRRFLDAEYGGWYPLLNPDNTPAQTAKGGEWKMDYHVIGMCAEAMRLRESSRR